MRLAALLDGNNGSLSMTLGLGDPIGASFTMAESKMILGRGIKEPSLFSRAGTLSPSAPYLGLGSIESPGGGDGAGSGSSGGEASAPGDDGGSGNDGSDG